MSVETAFRGSTSKRGIGWVNFWIPNVGLGDNPVGTLSASALGARTPKPPVTTSIAANIFSLIPMGSRRDSRPKKSALVISKAFHQTFSACCRRQTLDVFQGSFTSVPPHRSRERYVARWAVCIALASRQVHPPRQSLRSSDLRIFPQTCHGIRPIPRDEHRQLDVNVSFCFGTVAVPKEDGVSD
jgi:hypothetical protein